MRDGLADDRGAADDDGARIAQRDLVLREHAHDPERRARDERRPAEVEAAGVHRVQPVDVLRGIDRLDHLRLVEVVGQRQLDEDPVDGVVGIQVGEQREQLLLGRLGRQAHVLRVDADALRGLLLEVDVDVRGGIVADEHGREADLAQLLDLGGDLFAHLRREGFPVDHRGCHGGEVIASATCDFLARTPTRSPRASRPLGLPQVDVSAYATAAESVTGIVEIPVSVAQLQVSLGEYELSEDGEVVESGRAMEEVVVPLAHTEGSLTASMQRGARAVEESGGFRTHVVADRITRASCFVCRDAGDALTLARWIEKRVDEAREWLRASDIKELSKHAVLREVKTHVVGPMCHVLWRWTTGDAVGPNMMTRNAYALNMAFVLPNAPVPIERAMLEANMGGDKKPSYEYFQSGHGKTVIAEATLTDEAIRRVLRTTPEDLDALAWVGTHGAVASGGMQSVAFTPASAIAAVFAATGQDLGMVGTSEIAVGRRRGRRRHRPPRRSVFRVA